MEIETKYDIGQTIYAIKKGSKEIKVDKITEITVWDDGLVIYTCQRNYCNSYDEEKYFIFDNKEEAEKKVKEIIDEYIDNL